MTEDEVKELNEQIEEAGGSKYVNSFDVIGCNHDVSILFMTHEVPTTCVTISYKACHRLIELLQEALDGAKSKEVSSDIGLSALQYKALAEKDMAEAQKASPEMTLAKDFKNFHESAALTLMKMGYTYEGGVRWKPPPGATSLQEALKEDDALLNTARGFWVKCDDSKTI